MLLLLHGPKYVWCAALKIKDLSRMRAHMFSEDALQVLIVSYETFRLHADKFRGEGACDLLICDEAHRLKNDQTLTNKARWMPALNIKASCLLTAGGQAVGRNAVPCLHKPAVV